MSFNPPSSIAELDLTPPSTVEELQFYLIANFSLIQLLFSTFTYTEIAVASYDIQENELFVGMNIFGVTYAGDVDITLPPDIDPRKVIAINDEVGLYTITITVR